jgi:hypothetical protein
MDSRVPMRVLAMKLKLNFTNETVPVMDRPDRPASKRARHDELSYSDTIPVRVLKGRVIPSYSQRAIHCVLNIGDRVNIGQTEWYTHCVCEPEEMKTSGGTSITVRLVPIVLTRKPGVVPVARIMVYNHGDRMVNIQRGTVIGTGTPFDAHAPQWIPRNGRFAEAYPFAASAMVQSIRERRNADVIGLRPVAPDESFVHAAGKLTDTAIVLTPKAESTPEEILSQIKFDPKLTPKQRAEAEALTLEFIDVFATNALCPPAVPHIFHTIDTGTAPPFKIAPFPLTPAKRKYLLERMQKLVEAGLIERSNSPYASPALIVAQKDGKEDRLVIDYRKLNSQTTTNATPIYRTTDIIHQCGKSRIYTTMDLAAGYHQIKMNPDSVDKTAFRTPDGLYNWLRMPQGVKNGPGEFCRYVGGKFTDLGEHGAQVYFNLMT